jgi:hypothetical protein
MGILPNPRHEHFAQLLAQGETVVEAHTKAGYKRNRGNASTLANQEIILKRVAELQDKATKRHDVTVDTITDELNKAIADAFANNQPNHAIQGIQAKAKLHGLMVDRTQNENVNTSYVIAAEPEDEDPEAWLEKHRPD